MNEDRLQILKMVEEGKVSAQEALKLLEAVEVPAALEGEGPKATHLRFRITEGGKTKNFSLGLGLVRWMTNLIRRGNLNISDQLVDTEVVLAAIEAGRVGKVVDITDGDRRVEIWLDA